MYKRQTADYSDDGISQKTTIRTGVQRVDVQVPNPVSLIPVSYTHLDVYKRQALPIADPVTGALKMLVCAVAVETDSSSL